MFFGSGQKRYSVERILAVAKAQLSRKILVETCYNHPEHQKPVFTQHQGLKRSGEIYQTVVESHPCDVC